VAGAPFRCDPCGFLYYFNAAVSVAALILQDDGRGLFIRRGKEPARGKLALIGGFVDPGETLQSALRREVREEVNLELSSMTYLAAFPNEYLYRDVAYPVVDVFFVCRAMRPEDAAALDAVESLEWRDVAAVDLNEIAFASMREALCLFLGDPAAASAQRRGSTVA
jgi:ADP-ribose pyrophosphatase YjhB (NUDIX family)